MLHVIAFIAVNDLDGIKGKSAASFARRPEVPDLLVPAVFG